MYFIVIREKRDNDTPALSELVRNAYLSNVTNSWKNALFNEITFQLIVLLSAFLFICFGIPLTYCAISIPIVLIGLYVIIYGTIALKAAQLLYEKKPLKCWVAESYEPYFFTKNPDTCWYKIINEEEIDQEAINQEKFQRKLVGSISVMKHFQREDWAWLFRLTVDQRYRRKGVGLRLIETVKDWCRNNHFNNIELAMSECQEGSRELFNDAGFQIKLLYHKKLLTSYVTLQMFQLACEVRSTF